MANVLFNGHLIGKIYDWKIMIYEILMVKTSLGTGIPENWIEVTIPYDDWYFRLIQW